MGILNRLFSSAEFLAKEIKADDEYISHYWKKYLETIPAKKAIIEKLLVNADLKKNLQELKKLLDVELVDISGEDIKESELISDLNAVERSQKIKSIHRLEQQLGYAETKHEYVHGLLEYIYSALKKEMHAVKKLISGSKNAASLIQNIKTQMTIEEAVIKKISNIQTFHSLFSALAKGEHIIGKMDAEKIKLLGKMKQLPTILAKMNMRMWLSNHQISLRKKDNELEKWVISVFNGVEIKVHLSVMEEVLDYHPDVHFQFVNRPEFVEFVRDINRKVLKQNASEEEIKVFVRLFREWYNREIN